MNQSTDYSSVEFHYQADFRQFLEEATNRATGGITNATNLQQPGKQHLDGEKRSRKSWKSSLLSWLKTIRKCNPNKQPGTGNTGRIPKFRHSSGPVRATLGSNASDKGQRVAALGPLSAFFSSIRGEEYEVPYMCLDKPTDGPRKIRSYGPVYLVT